MPSVRPSWALRCVVHQIRHQRHLVHQDVTVRRCAVHRSWDENSWVGVRRDPRAVRRPWAWDDVRPEEEVWVDQSRSWGDPEEEE